MAKRKKEQYDAFKEIVKILKGDTEEMAFVKESERALKIVTLKPKITLQQAIEEAKKL